MRIAPPSPSRRNGTDRPLGGFLPRSSIQRKVVRQSVLLVTFCILLLGGLSFSMITSSFPIVPVDFTTALQDVRVLSSTVLLISGLLLVMAFMLGTLLARGLTRPLEQLSDKVATLEPGTWKFERSIETGDEVEALDRAVADLTSRLRGAYQHLEDMVVERTREFREEYALDRAILESIEYGVIAFDAAGNATDCNTAATKLLLRAAEEIVGKRAGDVVRLRQREKDSFNGDHPVLRALRDRVPYRSHPSLRLCVVRPDESVLPVTLFAAPLVNAGKVFGAIAIVQDVTLERQIDYLKSEFISLASHQLRTPLSSIRWYVEALADGDKDLSADQRSFVNEIDTASKRMANLIEALLHVARLEEGKLTPEKATIDLSALLERTAEEWRQLAKEKGVTLLSSIPHAPLPAVTDPVLLQVVMQNLLSNALKYSAQRPIEFTAERRGGSAVLTVKDSGVGIPAAEQPRMFQKFFRAKNVREFDTDGTGLGLYITKSIVETLGGTLSFQSAEGKGTSFTVTLPLAV